MDFVFHSISLLNPLIWVIGVLPLFFITMKFFPGSALYLCLSFMVRKVVSTMTSVMTFSLPGTTLVLSGVFIFLLFGNLWGLFPGLFGVSCHMVFVVFLSLHLWFSLNISSSSYNFTSYLGHLTPLGAPLYLVPLLNLMEGVSNLIRPVTLTLRLTINMTTGHMLLNLLNVSLLSVGFGSFWLTFFVLFLVVGYCLFEVGVCLVQSGVFCLLLSQYTDDHPV